MKIESFLILGGPAGGSNPDGFSPPNEKKYHTWLVQTDKEYFIRQKAKQIERQMLGVKSGNNFTKMSISRDPV